MANLHHTSGKIFLVWQFGLEVQVNLALREVRWPDVNSVQRVSIIRH
jgi:hypothetical protein